MNSKTINPQIECYQKGHLLTPAIGKTSLKRCMRCGNYFAKGNGNEKK